MLGRETQSCLRCNYLGVPVEHTSDRDDPESWDDAISRFYEKYGGDAEVPVDVSELDASDPPDDFTGDPEELADLENETGAIEEERPHDEEATAETDDESGEEPPEEGIEEGPDEPEADQDDSDEPEADQNDSDEPETDQEGPDEPDADGEDSGTSESEADAPDEIEESETDSSVTAETDGGTATDPEH